MKKTLGLGFLLVGLLGLSSLGCFGPFKLTKGLYEWNASFENKWAQEGIFLAIWIIPVYGLAVTVDAYVLNVVEFWSEPRDKRGG